MDGLFQKIICKLDDDWGYPYDSGNHHIDLPSGTLTFIDLSLIYHDLAMKDGDFP